MGKFRLPEAGIPDVQLSPERQAALIAEVDAVIQHTLELRGAFAAGGRQLDKEAWKLVKTKDDVRAYRSRRALHGGVTHHDRSDVLASSSSSDSATHRSTMDKLTGIASSASSGDSDHLRLKKTSRPPAVVLSGVITGTAEDAALGMLADTEAHAMMRNSYLGTELEDSRLLAVLVHPNAEHPLNFIGLKWGLQSYGRFSQARDFLFLEASGLMKDAKGKLVAYVNVAATAYAENLMALVNSIECANAYKLTWLMKKSARTAHGRVGSTSHCANCTRSLNKLGNMLFQRGGTCQVCRRVLCGKCSVNKKISVGIGAEVMQKSMLFCLECLLEAKQIPANQVAVDMLNW
ncbi:hypothetical protein AM588_10005642 [Phytophthora nicotianae]|uniref:FYVE-type domain-containing protein n=1 Tax=Phytophthora nicotianae TaxID=4792 RepID=A0A0W8D9Z3_PHYNI|nr:hypothetical protein AM588_10005642 [Phytophthora nicotianae]